MKFATVLFIICFFTGHLFSFGQGKKPKKTTAEARTSIYEKRTGIARIQIFASPAKGISIADIAGMPLFFGKRSETITYRKRTALSDQLPPTTGEYIRDISSDSLAIYFKTDIFTMSGYGDITGSSKGKRNMIHDLPTENPQKLAVDTIFDEAIDIGCYWTFEHNAERNGYVPNIMLKMEIYDKSGQARPEKIVALNAKQIETRHFKDLYGVEYNFVKGLKSSDLEDGGIAGSVVADVYLQALNKLLEKK